MNEVKLRVRYEETDQMGLVYHGKYFVWFEVGRSELFRAFDLPYTLLEQNQIFLPVTEAACKYLASAKYDDELTIHTSISKLSPARISFVYQVLNVEDRVVASGNTTHAFIGPEGKPVNVAKKAPWLWEKLQAAIKKLHLED